MADDDMGSGKTVLMTVISDQHLLEKLTDELKETDFSVVAVRDGYDAISSIADVKPDLLLLEDSSPVIDGYQIGILIKNSNDYRHVPIILLSDKESLFDKSRARISGADRLLPKNFTSASLLETLRHCNRALL